MFIGMDERAYEAGVKQIFRTYAVTDREGIQIHQAKWGAFAFEIANCRDKSEFSSG